MSATRRVALASAATVIATAGAAGAAQAAVVHGTVVHRNARAHSFVVADHAGHLFAIHAAHSPRPGTVVTVSVRGLRNGTYAARRTHVLTYRHGARVRLRGTVSFVDRKHGTFTLSARGVSMLVRTGGGRVARMADALPAVGTIVTATGTVDDQGDLSEQTVQTDGTDTGSIDVEGTVLAVSTGTITVSSTDNEQTSGSIVVSVPSTLDISMFAVGQEVELQVTPQTDGSYVLAGSSSDQGTQGANNQGDQQGNQGDGQGDSQSGSTSSDSGSTGSTSSDSSSTGSTSSDSSSTGSTS